MLSNLFKGSEDGEAGFGYVYLVKIDGLDEVAGLFETREVDCQRAAFVKREGLEDLRIFGFTVAEEAPHDDIDSHLADEAQRYLVFGYLIDLDVERYGNLGNQYLLAIRDLELRGRDVSE